MKKPSKKINLLRKTSDSFILISAILMVISSVCLYFFTVDLLQTEVEEELYSTEDRIEKLLQQNGHIASLPPVIEIREVDSLQEEYLKDTVIYDPSQDEMELFHELSAYRRVDNKNYQITVRALVVESEDILIAVVTSYIIILLLAFLILHLVNTRGNQRVWKPFFQNLDAMQRFSLQSETPIALKESDIKEFTELNREIRTLTEKVRHDYENLRQFTENVAHELQTPLAIIQAKIENILNEDNLNNLQFEHLTSIQKDITRLTQFNKKLSLLTKIDNKQFQQLERINLSELLAESVENFREMSNIPVHYDRTGELWVEMDMHLASVLCTNLLSNAIKYSEKGSEIQVATTEVQLTISNRGEKALQQPEKLFGRYYRESKGNKTTGLGLAIVKRICDLYGFGIRYSFVGSMHSFEISVNSFSGLNG